jgi:hypothetical protein
LEHVLVTLTRSDCLGTGRNSHDRIGGWGVVWMQYSRTRFLNKN